MNHLRRWIVAVSVAGLFGAFTATPARAQAQPFPGPDVREIYNRLLPQIEAIRAFDNHGHPGFADDPNVDAMAIPPDSAAPLRLRDENAEILDAVKFLFNYPYSDFSPEHQRWLVEHKAAAKSKLGAGYFPHSRSGGNRDCSCESRLHAFVSRSGAVSLGLLRR